MCKCQVVPLKKSVGKKSLTSKLSKKSARLSTGKHVRPVAADPRPHFRRREDCNAEGHSGQDEDDDQHSYADALHHTRSKPCCSYLKGTSHENKSSNRLIK